MSQRTHFLFTGAHVLPAVMVAANADNAAIGVLTYLPLLGVALLSAMNEQKTAIAVRIRADEEQDIRRRR